MTKKYRAIKVSEQGNVTDEKGDPIVCPIRGGNCINRCAWYSVEDRIIHCQDTVIGAIRGKPIRSFRLILGPLVYDPDEAQGPDADNQ